MNDNINYCDFCELAENCLILKDFNGDYVDFCDGCKDYYTCDIKVYCEAGHYVQCNNGYEVKSIWDDAKYLDMESTEADEEIL